MPVILGLGEAGQLQDPREALNSLSKRYPKPTNAQALAALNAFWEATSADAAKQAGMHQYLADSFLLPLGILPRMRLLACGFISSRKHKLRPADDAKWYAATYKYPLWAPLGTWVDECAKTGFGGQFSWSDKLAAGDSQELSKAIIGAADDWENIVREKADGCAPYHIPKKRGVYPQADVQCLAWINTKRQAGKVPEKLIPKPIPLPWWVWVALGFVAIREIDRR